MINKKWKKVRFYSLLASTVLLTNSLLGQNVYSLRQCIDTALKNSLQLKSDNLDMDKTRASIGQAYSSLLPTLSASGSYQYYFKVPVQLVPGNLFGGAAGTYQVAQFSVPQTKSGSVDLSQTLFNASSLIALKAAKVAVNLNQLQIQSSKEDLVYNVSATYYNIQTIMKQIELTSKNLQNTEELLQSTRDQYNAGLATETDVDRLNVSRDNSSADLASERNNLEKQYNMLKFLMNLPLESIIGVPDYNQSDEAIPAESPAFDISKKTDYMQIIENRRVADLEKKNIKAGYLPTLSLGASYGLSGYYSNTNPFKNLNEQWYSNSYIKLALNIPIFDGFNRKYKIQSKSIEIKKYDVEAEQLRLQSAKNVANAIADLKSNFLTLQSKRRSLDLSQKVLNDLQLQYQNGIAKITDVINSQSDLHTAQNNYINALINIKQAELDLKKAQGTLLN
jgi:outer membrane protein